MAIVIWLSDTQEEELMNWSKERTAAEVASGCEPSGYSLTVDIWILGTEARATAGSAELLLGPCEVKFGQG